MKTKDSMTLDRVLSRMGLTSRTSAREAIVAGRLKVNGRVVRDPDIWVQPARDVVLLDGNRVKPAHKTYLLFYKPKGVITSHGDPGAEKQFTITWMNRSVGSLPSAVWIKTLPDCFS